MKVRELLTEETKINYLSQSEKYIESRVNIYNADGSGRIKLSDSLEEDAFSYFVEDNNTINIYIVNSINGLRIATKMNQREFAEYFGIPIRTLQEWEQGRRNPPAYVLEMMKRIWKLENR